jgi:hypothetical protein
LLQYFQKNGVEKIFWDKDKENLIIEFQKGDSLVYDSLESDSEFIKIKNYLEKIGKNEISFSELGGNTNPNTVKNPQDSKILLWLGLGGILLMVGGIITYLVLKRRKVKNCKLGF